MYQIDKITNSITALSAKGFGALGFSERAHLQEWIAKCPECLGEELLILAKEFDGFDETKERLDMLALDKQGCLVLIENKLDDSGGDWKVYLDAIYAAFQRDFVTSKPSFRGRRLGLKRHPEYDGKEATFWHMISEGSVETERTPDFRRCERIRWPRPLIEHEAEPEVLVWIEPRGANDDRIHIYLPAERYLVVLADRGSYILPWTAFYIEHENGHRKYLQRHARHT